MRTLLQFLDRVIDAVAMMVHRIYVYTVNYCKESMDVCCMLCQLCVLCKMNKQICRTMFITLKSTPPPPPKDKLANLS